MNAPMKLKLPYVTPRLNIDGSTRYYFRRRGQPIVPLPGNPTMPEFMDAYQRCLNWHAPAIEAQEGSFAWACDEYLNSAEFKAHAKATREARRRVIIAMMRERLHPDFPETFAQERVVRIEAKHIRVLRDRKAENPNAANERLKILSQIFKLAVARNWSENNPVKLVERFGIKTNGHETATDEDIERYFQRHTSGPAYVAGKLLTEFGIRVSDLRIVGWQHVKANGVLVFDTFKTGVRCELDPDPGFWSLIPKVDGQLTFLLSHEGRPYGSDKSLSQMVSDWFAQAGCVGVTAHSVRKWLAAKMAEAGATEMELIAWFGWRDAKEARPYTSMASRRKMAASGKAKLRNV